MKLYKRSNAAIAAVIGGALMITGASAFAADTADLAVTGNIVPSACVPTFVDGNVADFGTIKTVDLPRNDYKNVGTRKLTLNVRCSSIKAVDFNVVDNQAASSLGADIAATLGVANAAHVYGLGTATIDDKSIKLGSYALSVATKPSVDGKSAEFRYAPYMGAEYTSPALFIDHAATRYAAVLQGNAAAKGTEFTFPVTVTAAINKGSLLPLSSDVDLNGSATFSIAYW